MSAFELEFKRTDLLVAVRHDNAIPPVGSLLGHGITHYAFHGIGLSVDFEDNTSVDFDFAFLPEQRHDGFDLWRLCDFVSTRTEKYGKYVDTKKLEEDFHGLIGKGVVVKPNVHLSTTLYFFRQALINISFTKAGSRRPWRKFW